jgi:DNA-binding NarL/FixJ family response regulator
LSLEIVPSNNAAGQALARVLRLALPDDAACKRALQDALRSANRAELPTDGDELLRLVRVHLAPQLSKDVPPNLVFALIDDLKAEIEQQRSGRDPTSSSRMRAATSFPPPVDPGAGLPEQAPLGEAQGNGPFPKLRASISNLLRTTASAMRASAAPIGTAAPASAQGAQASVVVVESDRMMRAALARALVGARFDVTVLEDVSELAAWMREHATRVVAVVDVMGDGVQGALQTVAAAHPSLSVVAWSDAAPSVVEGALSSLGLARYGFASKASGGAHVVDRVRALFAAGN